jgi:glycosyltransferase involved in cell wall biosynthesis
LGCVSERRTIVVARPYGELAGRIVRFAHLIATAIEHELVLLNPAFNEHAHLFPAMRDDLLCRFPPGECLRPETGLREAIRAAATAGADALHRAQKSGRDVGLIRLDHDEFLNLGSATFCRVLARHPTLVLDGSSFRNPHDCVRHRDAIRSFFTPDARVLEQVRGPIEEARRAGKLVVGVHVCRGTDTSLEGRRLRISDADYRRVLIALEPPPDDREVAFFVTSDQPISDELTDGLDVIPSAGLPIEDLYGLSACDYLIGPPSTFSRWAAFYGNVPLHSIGDPAEVSTYDSFQVDRRLELGGSERTEWIDPVSSGAHLALRTGGTQRRRVSEEPNAAPSPHERAWPSRPAAPELPAGTGSNSEGSIDPSGLVLSVIGMRAGSFGGMTRHAQAVVEMMPVHASRWAVRPIRARPGWHPPPLPRDWQRKLALVEAFSWTRLTPGLRHAWPDVPIVVRSGGIDVHRALAIAATTLTAAEYRDWIAAICESVDLVIVNSTFSAARLAATDLGTLRTAVVRGGAVAPALRSIRQTSERPVAVIVGRIVPWKGMELGIEAIALAQQHIDIDALVVGDGPGRASLEDLARERLHPGTWQFTGALPHEYCLRLIAESDVLVSMSRVMRTDVGGAGYDSTETMGRAICESLVAGVPVVATSVGGVPELVRPGAGTLVEEDDVRAAATAIVSHVRSGRLDNELVRGLRAELGWPAVVDIYARLFDDLCENDGHAPLLQRPAIA